MVKLQTFFIFTPIPGEVIQFGVGSTHQLDILSFLIGHRCQVAALRHETHVLHRRPVPLAPAAAPLRRRGRGSRPHRGGRPRWRPRPGGQRRQRHQRPPGKEVWEPIAAQ